MKSSAKRGPNHSQHPIASREAEYSARRASAEAKYDDRVSENLFDIDGERAEINIIIHGISQGAH